MDSTKKIFTNDTPGMVEDRRNLVVLTGAGMSAESGLKTFRDGDGLWMGYNVEDVATPRAFKKDPKLELNFYNMRRKEVSDASPNAAHFGFAELEKYFNVTIVTQNIDDLHERAGSTNVIHLHGEIFKMRGEKDENKIYEIRDDINVGDVAEDGSQLRPHIVWFEEPVPMIIQAMKIMTDADIFVLVGSSLQVYPAAGLINYVPPNVPKYIIDKKIPIKSDTPGFIFIVKPATEGVEALKRILLE